MTSFLIGWASYVLVTFALGAVWHLALFKDVYIALQIYSRIEDPVLALGLLAMTLQGAVLSYLYPFYRGTRDPLARGLSFGLLMGVFMGSSAVIAEAGKQHVTSLSTWLILESAYYFLQFTLVGAVLAVIHRRAGVGAAEEDGRNRQETNPFLSQPWRRR